LSTFEARSRTDGHRHKNGDGYVDSLAATYILQDFLDQYTSL
jgi:RNase H-fold protein (predicted Holliday junction resolvase)